MKRELKISFDGDQGHLTIDDTYGAGKSLRQTDLHLTASETQEIGDLVATVIYRIQQSRATMTVEEREALVQRERVLIAETGTKPAKKTKVDK
jgi:hypothetical protein